MNEEMKVKITEAKGRPMLTWVGKRPLKLVTAFPAQHIETFDPTGELRQDRSDPIWADWPRAYPKGGLLFHGDNKDVLAHLLANGFRGKVNLIYIDPPFDSGADYVRRVQLRGVSGSTKIDGETYTLGEQIQYTDIWANDNYLQFMYERLLLLRELMNEERGLIGLQCDWRKNHHLRCLMDEVFGPENFRGEVLVRAGTKNVQSQFAEISSLSVGHNSILLYTRSTDMKLSKLMVQLDEGEPGKWDTFWRGTDRPTMRYELFGQHPTSGQWRWKESRTHRAISNYKHYLDRFAATTSLDEYYSSVLEADGVELDFVRLDESGTIQYYVRPRDYRLLSNVWFDLSYRGTVTDYPTEKHEEPIHRLMSWSTRRGDVVLDCFAGSGTTVAVAQQLGRRWIGCDINKGAVQTASRRIQGLITEQISNQMQQRLVEADEDDAESHPSQKSFTVWRVNDYDLSIQHNEAINIACEHIGVERTWYDSFFDGTLGKRLVKIIPFAHPLGPVDLEEIRKELEARHDEDRSVVVVCLGKEISADAWLDEWNRLRGSSDSANRIDVIELRTDPVYGRFLVHEPASARCRICRVGSEVKVEILDFVSPTIIKRLDMDASLFSVTVTDWRSMVDAVMIDTCYDGRVFNVVLSDVPERRDDLVRGTYELPIAADEAPVAVKIIDCLGEEVLIVEYL